MSLKHYGKTLSQIQYSLISNPKLLFFFQTYFSSTICFWYSSYSSLDIPSWDILLVAPASSAGWIQWVWSDDLWCTMPFLFFWIKLHSSFRIIRVNPMRGFSEQEPNRQVASPRTSWQWHRPKKEEQFSAKFPQLS